MDTPRLATGALPPLFISHGSPMTALQPGAAGAFWQALGRAIDAEFGRPRAVISVSAHTLTREPVLLAAARHPTVHDFGGFPAPLYQLRYDAPGAPEVAIEAQAALAAAGMPAQRRAEGGLDHGAWVPLRALWPAADVPVLPLGWPANDPPQRLTALGAALQPLTERGVLLLASGSLTHNLRWVFEARGMTPLDAPERPETAAFRRWVHERAEAGDAQALQAYRVRAPHAVDNHPTDEHWAPWYLAMGAGGEQMPARRLHASLTHGSLAMDAYAFGPQAARLARALAEREATAA